MTVQVFNRAARLPFGAYKMCAEACSAQMILETTSFHQEGFQKPSRRELLPVTTMDDTDNVNNCNNSGKAYSLAFKVSKSCYFTELGSYC